MKKIKILSLILGIVVLAIAPMILIVSDNVLLNNNRSELITLNLNSLKDMTELEGEKIATEVGIDADGKWKNADVLASLYEGAGLEGVSSSYAYVADAKDNENYTILYHPTAEKIGEAVSDSVIVDLIDDIAIDKSVTTGEAVLYNYESKGNQRCAAYYINPGEDYIVVMSAIESDLLKDTDSAMISVVPIAVPFTILVIIAEVFLVITLVQIVKENGKKSDHTTEKTE